MAPEFVGREAERAAGTGFLLGIENGPAGFLIEGEVGSGKSLLLAQLLAAAPAGMRVLAYRASCSEAEMPYCALADLIAPIADEVLGSIPEPQRLALGSVLLAVPAGDIDTRAVAAGFLSVLKTLATSATVLVAIDDAHWLDEFSAVVLGYAGRRLGSAPVGMMWTSASDRRRGAVLSGDLLLPPDAMHRVQLGPLSLAAIRRILLGRLGPLPRRTLLQIHEQSGGNPLFALELAAAHERSEGLGRPTMPFDAVLSRRIAALSPVARATAVAAAALGAPTVETLCRVAGAADWTEAGGAEVEAAGIFSTRDGIVAFIHPPLAASAYASASEGERRALHGRLADLTGDRVEQARHLGLSAPRADADVAHRLDLGAAEAGDRGAGETAVELAEAALRLTPLAAGDDRRRRRLVSAEYLMATGDRETAGTRLTEALAGMAPGPERGEVLRRLGVVFMTANRLNEGRDRLAEARTEAGEDPTLLAAVERDLAVASLLMGAVDAAGHHAYAAVRATRTSGRDPLVTGAAAAAVTVALFAGRGVAPGWVAHAAHWEAEAAGPFRLDVPWLLSALPARLHDDVDAARARLEQHADGRRSGGRAVSLICELAEIEAAAGRWAAARAHADTAIEGCESGDDNVGAARALAIRGQVRAATGEVAAARADLTLALELTAGRGVDLVQMAVVAAFGFLEITVGDDEAAASRLEPITQLLRAMGVGEPALMPWIPDCLEAMISVGDRGPAEDLLVWYEAIAGATGRARARAGAARCRSLLAARDGDLVAAAAHIERAVNASAALPYLLEHGRNLLIQGSVARRRKLKSAARKAVGEAIEVFEQQGATAWAARARQERLRLEPSRGPDGLTALEARVAEHVLNRLSAREMAAQLFVSRRTVEGTLGRLYSRYGVHSRAELRTVWLDGPPAGWEYRVARGT